MSRFRSRSSDNDESGIDISPLIDCVFILLIFFIVTTTFVDETGVEVDKPQAASAVQLEKTSILLANEQLTPRADTPLVCILIDITSIPGTVLNRSSSFTAPDCLISSSVIT